MKEIIFAAMFVVLAYIPAGMPGSIAVATACMLAVHIPGVGIYDAALASFVTSLLVGLFARLIKAASLSKEA